MTTERTDEQRTAISAVKAERERDKAEAMREYQAERLAAQANCARLRALRVARESAQATAAAHVADELAKTAEKKSARRAAPAKPANAGTPRRPGASRIVTTPQDPHHAPPTQATGRRSSAATGTRAKSAASSSRR
jgi:hypothetical protein